MNTAVFEAHISAQIDDRIDGKTFVDNTELFSTLDHVTPSYVRDTGCWASDISNIACIAVANEITTSAPLEDSRGAGILVSPRHIIMADHYRVASGWIRFVDDDDNLYEYEVVDTLSLDGLYGDNQDIRVSYLNQDVDSSLGFADVMPSGSLDWLDNSADVPLFAYDVRLGSTLDPFLPRATVVENQLFIGVNPITLNIDNQRVNTPNPITSPQRYEFYDSKEVGDSGSPICVVINDELVLLATFWLSNAGTAIMKLYDLVNTAMATLSLNNGVVEGVGDDNYQLTDVDLDSFRVTVAGKWIL